jgi:hypothetical protein
VGEVVLNLIADAGMCFAEHAAEFVLEAVFHVLPANEIEHGEAGFALMEAQATAELLEEDGQALRGAQEEEGIHFRDIDALIEDIDYEEVVEFLSPETLEDDMAIPGIIRAQIIGFPTLVIKLSGHELRMLAGSAEAERINVMGIREVFFAVAKDIGYATMIFGVNTFQLFGLVSATTPAELRQIDIIADTKIVKRTKQAAVKGLGQADFGGDGMTEVLGYILTIMPLGCGG